MLADLHLHTCYSDGSFTPEKLVEEAEKCGIGILSVCDHDTIAGCEEAELACSKAGISFIPGVENTCKHKDYVLHILGYGYCANDELMAFIGRSEKLLLKMGDDLIEKMQLDYPAVSSEEFQTFTYDRTLGGWKALHYLLQAKVITQLEEGIGFYHRYSCNYSDYPFPDVSEVCYMIRRAGGCTILAHPANYFADMEKEELFSVLDDLVSKGIDGLECYYPSHSAEFTDMLLEYCNKKNLMVTAGSDSHGDFSKYAMGSVTVDTNLLNLGGLLNENSRHPRAKS